MQKTFTFKYFLKIGIPILLIIIIISGLAWMGLAQENQNHVVNNYNTFKSQLSKSLSKARKFALEKNTAVIICPVGTQPETCGTNENWEDGFIVYKKTKQLNSSILPESIIINTYNLNISSLVTTKSSQIEMQPNGMLVKTYQFIMKSKTKGDFPYRLTVEKNLHLYTKLLPSE